MTNYKQLCADLLDELKHQTDWSIAEELKERARAALAEPPSLKEQALKAVQNIDDACESEGFSRGDDTDIIRRALESLPD